MKLSVIIPTLNASEELPYLFKALRSQSQPIDEIIVVDSESTDHTVDICQNDHSIKLLQIKRKDFDHGKTRDMALRESIGDIVIFLTQDAIPANEKFVENLIKPLFYESKVVISTGRQLPKLNATKIERLIRNFNYPSIPIDSNTVEYKWGGGDRLRSKVDIPNMGIKTFFVSDVCAAYRRDFYEKLGGFDYPLRTNEDMFFAAKTINAGYNIAYVSDALVYHSHNFSLREQFVRNYIQGYEIEKHKEILCNTTTGNEGIKLVKYVSKELLRHGDFLSLLCFIFDCSARLLGNYIGKLAYHFVGG